MSKKMEQNTPKEYQSVTDALRNLRGLSENEISEEGILRSRIEQQSELISILKQRADEYLKKYMGIEDKIANTRNTVEETKKKLTHEKSTHDTLKKRFSILDENHVEMIKLKDEYKAENHQLRKENKELMHQNNNLFSAPMNDKDATIEALSAEVSTYQKKLQEAEENERDVLNQLEQTKSQSTRVLDELKLSLEEEQINQNAALEKMEKRYSSVQKELSDLQNSSLESDQKRKALEEKTELQTRMIKDQDGKMDGLKNQLDKERERIKYLESKYKKESEALSSNSTIRRLNAEIQEAVELKAKIMREFEAYKKHTTNLLSKERELNSKLRRFHVK